LAPTHRSLHTGYSMATPFTGSATEILSEAGISINYPIALVPRKEMEILSYKIQWTFLLAPLENRGQNA